MNRSLTARLWKFLTPPIGLTALAVVGLAVPAAAQAPAPTPVQAPAPAVQLTQPTQASVRVRVDNASQQPGRVQVVQVASGTTIYTEAYRTATYGHRFDFNHLPAGRYALLFSVGGSQYRYTVQVKQQAGGPVVTVQELPGQQAPETLASATEK